MFTVVPLTNQGQGKVTPVLESSVKLQSVPVPEISMNPGPQALSKVKNPAPVEKAKGPATSEPTTQPAET